MSFDGVVARWSMPFYRALTLLGIVLALAPFVTPRSWIGTLDPAGLPTGVLPIAGMFAVIGLWFAAPLILFAAPRRLAAIDNDWLLVPTTAGRRRLDLTSLRHVGALRLLTEGSDIDIAMLRDSHGRVVWLVSHGGWLARDLRPFVLDLLAREPSRVSARARHRLGVGPIPSRRRRVLAGLVTAIGLTAHLLIAMVVASVYSDAVQQLLT